MVLLSRLTWRPGERQVVGALTVVVAVVVAGQRHQSTAPSAATVALLLAAAPWVAASAGLLEPDTARRRRAVHAIWSLDVIACSYWLIIGYPDHHNDIAPFLMVILIGWMAADDSPGFAVIVAVACVTAGAAFDLAGRYPFGNWAVWCFAYATAWIGGSAYRWQATTTRDLHDAQAELSRQALEAQRHRLARDVHDLVAHSLAVTMLHLSGARLCLLEGDTANAIEALQEAEQAGRAAMSDIHRTVSLLTSPGEPPTTFATPGASDLLRLIEQFETAGLTLDASIEGDLDLLSPSEGLTAYRIVQESLANAVKHCPGEPVTLRATVHADRILIRVANPAKDSALAPSPNSYGLRGMAERAELLGGHVTANHEAGTWSVDAELPIRASSP